MYITIWYSAGVLTLCATTGGVLILCETNLLIVETANTILVWVPSGRAATHAVTMQLLIAHRPCMVLHAQRAAIMQLAHHAAACTVSEI